jgi:hypothetical protein
VFLAGLESGFKFLLLAVLDQSRRCNTLFAIGAIADINQRWSQ